MAHESRHAGYLLSDDPARLDVSAVHAFLTTSYWAAGIPRDVVARALENSLCLGVYAPDGPQVGLVRVITDSATFAYLCDVSVLAAHRGHNLTKAALTLPASPPRLQNLRASIRSHRTPTASPRHSASRRCPCRIAPWRNAIPPFTGARPRAD